MEDISVRRLESRADEVILQICVKAMVASTASTEMTTMSSTRVKAEDLSGRMKKRLGIWRYFSVKKMESPCSSACFSKCSLSFLSVRMRIDETIYKL